ncbi:hypothetical protein KQX54_001986 [Cotesia glomerata]|uniref:Farnesol dehydrogenase n=1 Tax=Cotesia glomerata TaxID=32391 RepID=A0AAV7I3H0_COTGL|nr:hypothetical protein KQX54_001986 [Cotesia glomerata]
MDRWTGKFAIVTGASSGIGRSITKELVSAGVNVLGLARRENRLQELSENLKSSKGAFHYLKCDLCNEEDILKAFEYVENNFQRLDILINNAGIMLGGSLAETTTEDYRTLLDLNVLAPALCIREALKLMRKHKNEAHIININSVFGLNTRAADLPINLYPASKYALHAMTETLKKEVRDNNDNIRVTGIYPSATNTELFDLSEKLHHVLNVIPALESKDVTDCIMFALSVPLHVQIDQLVVSGVPSKQ